jgi:CO dehydrogenase nickel-insertion accessory protein CooC1
MAAYIIDGDKGGVGKSFVARAVADYLITNKADGRVVVIDCDPSNADVVNDGGFYGEEAVGGVAVVGFSPLCRAKKTGSRLSIAQSN